MPAKRKCLPLLPRCPSFVEKVEKSLRCDRFNIYLQCVAMGSGYVHERFWFAIISFISSLTEVRHMILRQISMDTLRWVVQTKRIDDNEGPTTGSRRFYRVLEHQHAYLKGE